MAGGRGKRLSERAFLVGRRAAPPGGFDRDGRRGDEREHRPGPARTPKRQRGGRTPDDSDEHVSHHRIRAEGIRIEGYPGGHERVPGHCVAAHPRKVRARSQVVFQGLRGRVAGGARGEPNVHVE